LGSMLGNERVENVFDYGDHGSTFGGNPVAAAAGLAVFGEIEKGLMNNSGLMGEYLVKELKELQKSHAGKIKDIRGRGLMLGIEMNFECKDLIDDLMKNGVLTNCTNGNVIRLLPPMIMGKEEADLFLNKFEKVL